MSEADEFRPPAKTAIIGNQGRMGRMLEARARNAGLAVAGIDRPLADAGLAECCRDAGLVLLCVPARSFEEVVCRLVPFMPKKAILSDITSVKEAPMRQMRKHWPGAVVGTHPLFGPGAAAGSDQPVAIVPDGSDATGASRAVAGFFKALGCRPFFTSAEKHDQAMAKIQNMNFITNLAYFAALAGEEELLPFLTPSFDRRRQAAQKMLTEDADMFAGLFEANPHSHEAVRQYRRMLNLAASGDIDLLCHRAQWWFGDENSEPGRSGYGEGSDNPDPES